ncbi:MAG: C4-type zinc ribbon domain-containing protein [Bacteroidota bacterium]|nr:C4-type zinc ribbon domain-containing protein [Bacteroidota bacterium]
MKSILQSLYLLQLLDSELDELRELRGDLPETVNHMESELEQVEGRIEEIDGALKRGATERSMKEKESLELIAKIEKYKGQQLEVTNNREYDALTREMENAETTIATNEALVQDWIEQNEQLKLSKEQFEAKRDELLKELEVKREELKEILETTREEELNFERRREQAVNEVLERDMQLYQRIRAAKGKAVVAIRRVSCSGCYNVVPPQLILEIKKNDRLFTCEHCGRILVSEEIAQETKI